MTAWRDPLKKPDVVERVSDHDKRLRAQELSQKSFTVKDAGTAVPLRSNLHIVGGGSGGTASSWIESSYEGVWVDSPGGGGQAGVDWGVSNSDVGFSSDITRVDAQTFAVPSGTYTYEWMCADWQWLWTLSTGLPFSGEGWMGYRAGATGVFGGVSAAEWAFGEIKRVRVLFSPDTSTTNKVKSFSSGGGYGTEITMARGMFTAYGTQTFAVSLGDVPELYHTALDTTGHWDWPFFENPSNWQGDHWLRVQRVGDAWV